MTTAFQLHETYITELRGRYPDVPLAPGVRFEELTAGDTDPMFVTLRVGAAGFESRNVTAEGKPRIYPREVEQAVVEQVNQKKPVGIRGHLRAESRAYDNPPPVWRAVGAMLTETGETWVKFYVLPTAAETRAEIRTAMATNAPIGNSRYATGFINESGEVQAEGYVLEGFDFVHSDRVGLSNASHVPHVTTETHEDPLPEPEAAEREVNCNEEIDMTENETPTHERLALIQLREQHQTELHELQTRVATLEAAERTLNKLTELLDVGAGDNILTTAQALQAEVARYETENAELLQATIVQAVAAQVALASVQPVLVEMVGDLNPTTKAEVEAYVNQVVGRDSVKRMIKASVATEMGPAQPAPTSEPMDTVTESDNLFGFIPSFGEVN